MKKQDLLLWFLALLSVILGGSTSEVSAVGLGPDVLYIGDTGDNTVKRFSTDGTTWSSLDGSKGAFVTQGSASLTGPKTAASRAPCAKCVRRSRFFLDPRHQNPGKKRLGREAGGHP